jgi:transcriptional regulator with XRE-family HTH domain
MNIKDKIRFIRKEKKISQRELYERIYALFGEKSITQRTLERIETGKVEARVSSLYQIALGLGVSIKALYDGVEQNEKTGFSRWDTYQGQFIYETDKAFAKLLSGRNIPFLAMKLHIEPGSKTRKEQEPETEEKSIKWIYVLRGIVKCYVENETYTLKRNQCASFNSGKPHYFENSSKTKAICLLIQYPRHI